MQRFAEVNLLTTWIPPTATRGVHRGHPEATLKFKTSLGLSLPSLAALLFMVAGQEHGPAPPLYLPRPLWALCEVGQEPPPPPGPGRHLPPHFPLHHPPHLQNLCQSPLSSGAGKSGFD